MEVKSKNVLNGKCIKNLSSYLDDNGDSKAIVMMGVVF